jgi:hypothetical protein
MNDSHKKKHLPPPPLSDILGELPAGPYDSSLKPDQPPAPKPASADTLRLPRGALVAMRRSGGLKFRSREVVVYRDGRVNYDDGESGPRTIWTLSDTEMDELRGALEQAGLANLRAAGRHNPDAFAYEIVARPARRLYSVEAFQGSIPASLAPLIQRLNRLAGMDEPAQGPVKE